MSWTILVNRTEGHNKFWSHNEVGDVHWGRIGSRGQSGRYDMSNVLSKEAAKLNAGYVLVTRDGSTPYPGSIAQNVAEQRVGRTRRVSQIGREEPIEVERHSRRRTHEEVERVEDLHNSPSVVHRTTARHSEGIKVPEYDRTHREPQVDSYKTDTQGYIKYRSGYNRKSFDNYASTLRVVKIAELVDSNLQGVNTPFFKKAKEYFNRIPSTSQFNKPENFEQLRESNRPTYAVLFSVEPHNIEAVAIFGVHRTNKICDFLSLKKDTPYYTTILKSIIKTISIFVDADSKITFKIKSPTIRKEIKAIANYNDAEGTHGDNIVYNARDLRNGIPDAEVRPKRWID